MQHVIIYLRVGDTLAIVVDEFNQPLRTLPSITRGMRALLCLRLLNVDGEPLVSEALSEFVAWDFVIANDWITSTQPQIRVSDGITAADNEIQIPVTGTNTEELIAILGNGESTRLDAELAGYNPGEPDPGFLIQFDLNIRNRRGDAETGMPTQVEDGMLNAAQIFILPPLKRVLN